MTATHTARRALAAVAVLGFVLRAVATAAPPSDAPLPLVVPTCLPTAVPAAVVSALASNAPSPVPSRTCTPTTASVSPTASGEPTGEPTEEPTEEPTGEPSGSPDPTPSPEPGEGVATDVTYKGDGAGRYGDLVLLAASVQKRTGGPVTEGDVTFDVDGATYSAEVDKYGSAGVMVRIRKAPGSYVVTVGYEGTETYLVSGTKGRLTLARGASRCSLARRIVDGRVQLTAKVTDAGSAALSGVTVSFAKSGSSIGTARTASNGTATRTVTRSETSATTYRASWAGNGNVTGCSATVEI